MSPWRTTPGRSSARGLMFATPAAHLNRIREANQPTFYYRTRTSSTRLSPFMSKMSSVRSRTRPISSATLYSPILRLLPKPTPARLPPRTISGLETVVGSTAGRGILIRPLPRIALRFRLPPFNLRLPSPLCPRRSWHPPLACRRGETPPAWDQVPAAECRRDICS